RVSFERESAFFRWADVSLGWGMRFLAVNVGFPARGVCFGMGIMFPEARTCALAVKKTHFRKSSRFRWPN
ncbi:MAG TPA: hypothetical protein VIM46_00340, partial [Luteolibacter sp.]